jgi:mRNA-degrading endonuclease RelE of RelBE toxin-antitoxin system
MWSVTFHPLVLKEDEPATDPPVWKRIVKAIRSKLTIDPEAYGEPLGRALFGYWKLPVGDYRVVYEIHKREQRVRVLKIGPRRDDAVYAEMLQRAKKFLKEE